VASGDHAVSVSQSPRRGVPVWRVVANILNKQK